MPLARELYTPCLSPCVEDASHRHRQNGDTRVRTPISSVTASATVPGAVTPTLTLTSTDFVPAHVHGSYDSGSPVPKTATQTQTQLQTDLPSQHISHGKIAGLQPQPHYAILTWTVTSSVNAPPYPTWISTVTVIDSATTLSVNQDQGVGGTFSLIS